MSDRDMIGRLVWKDIIAIKSLVLAVVIAIVAANLLLFLIWQGPAYAAGASPAGLVEWSVVLWIIMPNLIALGAPAMLVGNEEESGTLDWLRTLPVRWQLIAATKFWVAMVAVAAVWLASSIVFVLINLAWKDWSFWGSRGVLSGESIAAFAFFMISLLLFGFVFAYLIRSPVAALIALVPIYVFYVVVTINVREFIAGDWDTVSGLGLGIATLFVLWFCQRMLARRRLWLPVSTVATLSTVADKADSQIAYPSRWIWFASRPTPVGSLVWQQLRQTGPLCLMLTVVSVVLAIVFRLSGLLDAETPRRLAALQILGGISPLFILLGASWFGAVVFYGDNVHCRRAFFADRGISPSRVWWTRMAPPAAGFVFTWSLLFLVSLSLTEVQVQRIAGGSFLNVLVLAAVLFSFGQLVSQWSERPLLAFLAAPAYTTVSLSPLLYLLDRFGSEFAVVALTIPVLLLASRHLTGRWLEGRVQRGYTARVLAYTAIAVLIPSLWVVAGQLPSRTLYRYATSHGAAAPPSIAPPSIAPLADDQRVDLAGPATTDAIAVEGATQTQLVYTSDLP